MSRLEDERSAFEALEVAADIQKLIASAPDHIWLDLGENLEALTDDATFRDLSAVTWSEDNATGCGIKYVRAALNGADAGVSEKLAKQIFTTVVHHYNSTFCYQSDVEGARELSMKQHEADGIAKVVALLTALPSAPTQGGSHGK